MDRLLNSILKETRSVVRDKEALLLLFIMPLAFVLIMSLAMKDAFGEKGGVRFPVVIVDNDASIVGKTVSEVFTGLNSFQTSVVAPGSDADMQTALDDVRSGKVKFVVVIPEGATKSAVRRIRRQLEFSKKPAPDQVSVRLIADPAMRADQALIVSSTLNHVLLSVENRILWEQFGEVSGLTPTGSLRETAEVIRVNAPFAPVHAESAVAPGSPAASASTAITGRIPTSVQQSVPAWSLFAMFFLVIPLSTSFIKERQHGALTRLRSMPLPSWIILGGKVVPYFIINQLQFAFMMLIGLYVVPLLGGDALTLGASPAALVVVVTASSLAAIGYGIMAAVWCRTTEQATAFGGASVIIFGALGGIMVPKFLMPPVMQRLSAISPMGWGLDAFLEIFVRSSGVYDILNNTAALAVFAIACMAAASVGYARLSK